MDSILKPESRGDALTNSSGTLLIVDDEPLNLDMLSRRLAKSGFEVRVAASGQEALRLISLVDFDLVLLDQMMPEMSGTEVLHTLRSAPATESLPIIMVTAVASSDKISAALDDGANDYITKPVDYKVALARIRSQLARRRAEIALRQSEERYALVSQATREGLWDWNLATGLMYFSPRWREMLGLEGNFDENADTWFSRIVTADRKTIAEEIEQYLRGTKDVLKCAYRMRHMDGSFRWMSCHGITTRDENGVPVRLVGSQADITEEKTLDLLTGLPNRLALMSRLEYAMERAATDREAGQSVKDGHAVLFLDLDDFKTTNDTLGHLAGDILLKIIAARLLEVGTSWTTYDGNVQPPLIARMGGDEFAILLEGNATEENISRFAAHIKTTMEKVFDLDGLPTHCVFSIGAALASELHKHPEDILREADIAMYSTKAEGLGKFVLYGPTMRHDATMRFELENDIRHALARDELKIVYQPKVNLATGLTYGVEALVRWHHPTRGPVEPSIFIPIAEKTSSIIPIGAWILRKSCQQVAIWNAELGDVEPLELSVNLSPREFKQKSLIDVVDQTLKDTGFPPALLHFELTEGALFDDIASARDTLHGLKGLGVGLDLDDFGTGYSSLKYLRELPFDSLKIDRYFIASLDPLKAQSRELVRAIVNMAKVLGLEIIAEGIETEAHRTTLRVLGCRFGQGFFFSKPLQPEAMHHHLAIERSAESAVAEKLSLPLSSAVLAEEHA